eukprot:gene3087-3858_t
MEPISIPSFSNRLVLPVEPNDDDFNYQYDESCNWTSIDSFEIQSTIGSGSYGEVYIVKEKGNSKKNIENRVFALKKIPYVDVSDSELIKKRAFRERDAMVSCNKRMNFRSPKLYGTFIDHDEGVFYFVMEYIGGGDFNSYIYKRRCENNPFTLDEIQFYIAELVHCIESFHSLGFIHRDIKPENIMINHNGHLILCDYGSANGSGSSPGSSIDFSSRSSPSLPFGHTPPNFNSILRNPNNSYTSYIGTPQYMAVEVVQGIIYSKLCDYWSLGAILFELITGQALFVESPNTTEQKIRENIGNWRGLLNTAISKNQPISKLAESLIREYGSFYN